MVEPLTYAQVTFDDDLFVEDVDDQIAQENSNNSKKENSKNKRKRNKKKKAPAEFRPSTQNLASNGETENEDQIEIELVPEEIHLEKNYAEFSKVFEYFKFSDANNITVEKSDNDSDKKNQATGKAAELERLKARMMEDEEEEEREKKENDQPKLSKKKLKLQSRLSVAALKQLVNRPDVVEMYDVTARDPKLLVHLKATRNTVQVPRHWCAKRKYLQGKRGFEKPPFELPDFIKRTGIQSMREAVQEKDKNKSLKQKMREKVRPKTGRIDIDYQKLHDAFFRWQTKPKMTIHGDLYYEGKELEAKLKEKKPGNLTDELRTSLGMPTGPSADKVPPPWLIAMQRYGPPPSYPSLKIPGLNAPIPDGCSFGYHAGGWGKPPVDEFGRPLYGDVFGSALSDLRKPEEEEPVDLSLWGAMEDEIYEEVAPEELEESEEELEQEEGEKSKESAEEEEAEGEEETTGGLKTPGEGLMTPSGISTTVSAGLETPDMIELRKRKHQIESDMESMGGETPALYKILPEKTATVGASMMGSSKTYDISAAKSGIASTIEMALNPDELEMATDAIQNRFDQHVKQQQQQATDEESKQKKRKKQEEQASGAKSSTGSDKNKKYKEFKF